MDKEPQVTIIDSTIEAIKNKLKTLRFESSYENLPIAEINNGDDISDISLLVGKQYVYIYRKDITDKDHTHAKVQIGRVQIDKNGNPLSFIKDREDSLISETFDILSSIRFFSDVRNKYGVPNLGEAAKQEALKIKRKENTQASETKAKEDKVLALALQSSLYSRDNLSPSKEKIKSVRQGNYEIIRGSDNQFDYIETSGLAPCVAVIVWNKKTQDAGIIHMDARTPIAKLSSLLNNISGANNGDLVVDIVGGRPIDPLTGMEETIIKGLIMEQVLDIDKFIKDQGLKVRTYDVWQITNNPQKDIKNIVLDKKTGTLYDYNKK